MFVEPVVGLDDDGRVERVRLDDVRARLEVRLVDAADDVGPRETEEVVVALEILAVIREALAAEVGLAELVALDHRAHRAVEHRNTLVEQGGERGQMVSC